MKRTKRITSMKQVEAIRKKADRKPMAMKVKVAPPLRRINNALRKLAAVKKQLEKVEDEVSELWHVTHDAENDLLNFSF